MIDCDSIGGCSYGSGKPPVLGFQGFLDWLHDSDIRCPSHELAKYLYECVGFQRLVPYLEFIKDAAPVDYDPQIRNLGIVRDLVSLDDDLRSLLLSGIGIIEIQMKSQFNQAMLDVGGPCCLDDSKLFRSEREHKVCMRLIEHDVAHHARGNADSCRVTFDRGERILIWTAMNAASLDTVRRLYSNTRDAGVAHRVADSFGVNNRCLQSWLRTLSFVRNCCAHFNPYIVRTQIPAVPKPVYGADGDNAKPLYALAVVDRLLRGRAEAFGGLTVRDWEQFRQEAVNLIGAFVWRHPNLLSPLDIPVALVDAYAESRLHSVSFSPGRCAVHYQLVALAA